MIDGSEKRNHYLALKLHSSHVCEKCSNVPTKSTSQSLRSVVHTKNIEIKLGLKWSITGG